MKAEIYSHDKLIGTTDLQIGDESMGHLYGELIPTDNYFLFVQASMQQFWQKGGSYDKNLRELELNVKLSNGYYVFAAGGVTIDDLIDLPDEPLRINIAGVERHVIEDYFLRGQTHLFVEQPWNALNIRQKLTFEIELRKELGIKKGFWFNKFRTKSHKHALNGFEVSALCQLYDDVLFIVRKPKNEVQFALVHLTWRGAIEYNDYPMTVLYNSFDEFKYEQMYPDKRSWDE